MKWYLIAATMALSLCGCDPKPKISSSPAVNPSPACPSTQQPPVGDQVQPLPAPETGTEPDDMPPEDADGSPTGS